MLANLPQGQGKGKILIGLAQVLMLVGPSLKLTMPSPSEPGPSEAFSVGIGEFLELSGHSADGYQKALQGAAVARGFALFCTRITTCYAYRVETGPYFVPGVPHVIQKRTSHPQRRFKELSELMKILSLDVFTFINYQRFARVLAFNTRLEQ